MDEVRERHLRDLRLWEQTRNDLEEQLQMASKISSIGNNEWSSRCYFIYMYYKDKGDRKVHVRVLIIGEGNCNVRTKVQAKARMDINHIMVHTKGEFKVKEG